MLRCLGIALLTVLLTPATAMAHTNSVETSPEHGATLVTLPAEATITFSEPPTKVDVVLAKPDGKVDVLEPRVDGATVTVDLPDDGPRGDYGLSYRVVSADGHPVSGSATFTVTAGPKPAGAPAVDSEPASDEADESFRVPLPAIIGVAAVLLAVALLVMARRKRERA